MVKKSKEEWDRGYTAESGIEIKWAKIVEFRKLSENGQKKHAQKSKRKLIYIISKTTTTLPRLKSHDRKCANMSSAEAVAHIAAANQPAFSRNICDVRQCEWVPSVRWRVAHWNSGCCCCLRSMVPCHRLSHVASRMHLHNLCASNRMAASYLTRIENNTVRRRRPILESEFSFMHLWICRFVINETKHNTHKKQK